MEFAVLASWSQGTFGTPQARPGDSWGCQGPLVPGQRDKMVSVREYGAGESMI